MRNGSSALGIVLATASVAMFAAETACVSYIGPHLPAMQLALLRSIGGIALVAFLARKDGFAVFRTTRPGLQLVRSALSIVGVFLYIETFSRLPLPAATAITYAKVSFLTVIAAVVLGEAVSPLRWFACLLGGVGVGIITNVDFGAVEPAYVLAVLSAVVSAVLIALTRAIERSDSARTVMAYVATLSFLAYAVPGYLSWQAPLAGEVPLLLVITFTGALGQFLGILALRHADASLLAPIDYMRLVFAACLSVVVFGKVPDFRTIVGSVAILSACLATTASIRRIRLRALAIPGQSG